jgi:DNA-3-methyladenine glycosylase II
MSLRRSARLSITPSQNNSPAPQEKVTAKPLKKTAKAKAEAPKSTARKRKEPGAATASPSDAKTTNASEPSFPVPVTPNSKRPRTSTNLKPPPVTPTPSAVALIAEPQPASQPESQSQLDSQSQSQPISTPNTASKKRKPARPADPHATNAVLATPGGSKVAAYSDTSPVKWSSDVPLPSTTTDNLLDEACKHLISVDPKLKSVIEKHHCKIFSPEGLAEKVDPFKSLSTGIMGQQVRICLVD